MDIIATILTAAIQGATKTRLMYASYTSYPQLQEYLTHLQDNGLILYERGMQKFKLTEKGLYFLHVYEKISELVSLKNTTTSTTTAAQPEAELVAAPSVRGW